MTDKPSLVSTVISLVIPLWAIIRLPTRKRLLLCLSSSSLSYFLFSYHVHEKTILFPLLPLALLQNDFPTLTSIATLTGMARYEFTCLIKRER